MEKTRRIVCFMVIGLCLAVCVSTARAEPAPTLSSLAPIAIRQGTTSELTLDGQHLSSLTASSVFAARGLAISLIKADKPDAQHVHLKLTAASDAPPGEREVRLLGSSGVTPPIHVFVSPYAVIAAKASSSSDAIELLLPATLTGSIETPGQIGRFHFEGKKGEELIFNIEASRIGSQLDAVVTIHSEEGRELRPTIEHHRGDPVLVFTPPEDGRYTLQLRDLRYRGGPLFTYRIEAGHIPFLERLVPDSGRPGEVIDASPVGHNLDGSPSIHIDLTRSAPGTVDVCARTPLGMSNAVPFEVTELPQASESEPNDNAQEANPVSLPTEISGALDRPADEDCFRFRLPYKQTVFFEVLAGRFGSPVTPLLQLRNVKGDVIESNDGTPDADARITRELDAGEYVVSIRDLAFGGGPGWWYRLKLEPARTVAQDFSVRFVPDNPRLHRGGNVAIWCDVQRRNGFHGDVTITPEGLPSGVSAGPITLPENASGWFTLSAAPDAALGTAPLHLHAIAAIGPTPVTHEAEPLTGGRLVHEAFVTVLNPAPFDVEAVAAMTPQQIEQTASQIQAVSAKLNAPDQAFGTAFAQWEKKASHLPVWTVLNPATITADKGTVLVRQPDGSILATGAFPAQDLYSVAAHTELKRITAVRLEVLADPRLPGHGPGAAPNGNFVLSEFTVAMTSHGKPAQPIKLAGAFARYSQPNFPVTAAIDGNPSTGWAIDGREGRDHTAIFQTQSPIEAGDGTTLTFVLDHRSEFAQHNVGRFRISVTDANPAALGNQTQLPPNILRILSTPEQFRTDQQRARLRAYFRTIDPQTAAERSRLEAMRSFAAPYAEITRIQALLKAPLPQLEVEQVHWEKEMVRGMGWSVLRVQSARSTAGAEMNVEPDGSIFVDGPTAPTDTYELSATLPFKGITAIRIEALPDVRLPANGPGRAPDGNFDLTGIHITADRDIPIASATASAEQQGLPIGGALDGQGWAIAPAIGQPIDATFYLKQPVGGSGTLSIKLEQLSKFPQHTLGHFRIWATANPQPDAAPRPPEAIVAILKVPASSRSPEQKGRLAAYFRSIAPSLKPLRARLADLQGSMPMMPFRFNRNRPAVLPVPITRAGGFKGDVTVTLEGFVRAGNANQPAPITKEFKIEPLTLSGDKQFGMLTFEPDRVAETGTRMVVLKAESKIGDETVVTYSQAFPITLEK